MVRDEDGTVVGDYEADLVVEDCVPLELKAVKCLKSEHAAQVLNDLKATGIEVGLLINFGAYRFEMKRFARSLQFLLGVLGGSFFSLQPNRRDGRRAGNREARPKSRIAS